ncbi:hypothetical protein BYT27DRAFT_6662400 [Phlegmacium glaucopus]|nr:hypothetical protein BYT27DRAFT_6662400 [Phlegmacium glaucopus]
MLHPHWTNKPPTTPFEQTLYDADLLFYTTFPAARDAARTAALEQNLYDPTSPMDGSTSYDGVHFPEYEIVPDISSPSSPFCGVAEELTYPSLHSNCSQMSPSQPPYTSHHQDRPSYFSLSPVENDAAVYIPSEQSYHHHHQYPSDPTSWRISGSPSSSSFSAHEPSPFVDRPLSDSPNVKTELQETINDGYAPPESPRPDFCQLNRHMKPPTLKFTNNCQLAVMRLDRLSSKQGHLNPSSKYKGHSYAGSSKTFSPKSPSIGLSSVPSKNLPERKPPLACLFCRGRKIACGPPLPGSGKKTCNQCRKRSLQCHYPSESRRGMRKKKTPDTNTDAPIDVKPVVQK